jgi:hypothetical protein
MYANVMRPITLYYWYTLIKIFIEEKEKRYLSINGQSSCFVCGYYK